MAYANSFLSIEVPEGWKTKESEMSFPEGSFPAVKIAAPEDPFLIGIKGNSIGESFSVTPEVIVIKGPELEKPLLEFSREVTKSLRNPPASKVLKFEEGEFSGAQAYEITAKFSFAEQGIPKPVEIRRLIIHTLHKGRLFVITYTAHETQFLRNLKPAIAAIKSISLK